MPAYPLFLAGVLKWGSGGFLPAILIQVLFDCLSCVFIFLLAEKLWKGAGWLAGLLSAANVGMITYAHFILNDSLFLFVFLLVLLVFLLVLLALFRWIEKGDWKGCILIGSGCALSVYIRPVTMYFPLFLIPFLFLFLLIKHKNGFFLAAGKSIAVIVVFFFFLSPWLVRNHIHYGRYRLTSQAGEHLLQSQAGEHLLQYVVPFVWQYSKGIPFIEGMKKANREFDERIRDEGVKPDELNPFEKSERRVKFALEILKEEPNSAILKAWVFGMTKNLFAPSIIDMSYLLGVERPHFFYTK
ncbi:MAG: hypothetical protein JRI22_20825, partial [Deltaproteobacteria bacterium]|nr:hypothetical protein [Deltaproteobacteria bacterium]